MLSEEKIKDIIKAETNNNQITCGKLHDLSAQHGISLGDLGKIVDELNIKITRCELGCF